MTMPMKPAFPVLGLWAALAGLCAPPAMAQPPDGTTVILVQRLAAAPKVDGKVEDWGKAAWTRVTVQPADDKVEAKAVGASEVELAAGVTGGVFYLAARWPDAAADTDYRPWKWNGKAYKKTDDRDDMFAVRFHLDGAYDRCMITDKAYRADVWLWSAGRTNLAGLADDFVHLITTDLQDEAAEYKLPGGNTVYIKKQLDAGKAGWANTKAPKELTEPVLPGVMPQPAEGSAADVAARGIWANGRWTVEFERKLDTGHADDVVLAPGGKLSGAVAVFNKSASENKSVSGLLIFDFSAIK